MAHILATQDSIPVSVDNPLPIKVSNSDVIQPIDIQSHLQSTIQTHNAVSVAASGIGYSNWIDTLGYDKVALTVKNDASTSMNITLDWSSDGLTIQGADTNLSTGTQQTRALITDTKARYLRVELFNGDTVAHTMSAWAYLKC